LLREEDPRTQIKVSGDGRLIAILARLENIHALQTEYGGDVWSLDANGANRRLLHFDGAFDQHGDLNWTRVADVAFSPSSDFTFASFRSAVKVWRTADLRQNQNAPPIILRAPLISSGTSSSRGVVYDMTVSREGRQLAVADSNGTLALWRLNGLSETTQPAFFVNNHDLVFGRARMARFLGGGRFVAAGGGDGGIVLCRLDDNCRAGEPLGASAPAEETQWISWARGPNNHWLAAVSQERRVYF
jgi:WD40 repeat protein